MSNFIEQYDVIVVGGGHAGCEAALAPARMGLKTLMVTMNLDTIAQMSCNPAIGGLAKGHLVKEIDALGGEMARVADLSAIQFRRLNTKKGPAVWASRVQSDKKIYQFTMKQTLEKQHNLTLLQDTVTDIHITNKKVTGISTRYKPLIKAHRVIISTGTFLNGLIYIGKKSCESGRFGEFSSKRLSQSLKNEGFKLGRLKTGTPPRILRRSVDFNKVQTQPPDDIKIPFSRLIKKFPLEQIPCYITYTTQNTKEVIRNNLDKSPLYSGIIKGIGPRYCPSIEDKIVKFPDKEKHQIFIEPEGLTTEEMYLNGASSSLPEDVQQDIMRSITGLENVQIMRYAYGIEYDFITTDQILPTLETRTVSGLYLAGQINGTSGYEEAAAQGLMAGINAALSIQGKDSLIIKRHEGYIGVMIDDLIIKIPEEPYRMFTSRAEYRLLLREDNAYQRFVSYGHNIGLVPDKVYDEVMYHIKKVKTEVKRLNEIKYQDMTAAKYLKRPEIRYNDLAEKNIIKPSADNLNNNDINQIEIEIKYEGYIAKQQAQVKKMRKYESWKIPQSFDYKKVVGLRSEAAEKLMQNKPVTLGQALRISGVNPVDIQLVMIYLERLNRSDKKTLNRLL
ncbi:tRNA uridine-5-carboxymethylaminomethyl(34) synthesis enzyme MnmG [bacterium]|nr:tRNA uridine-5-carboxymethylaminomethyl(34) synthesis enzyme MnmG [bacterium]